MEFGTETPRLIQGTCYMIARGIRRDDLNLSDVKRKSRDGPRRPIVVADKVQLHACIIFVCVTLIASSCAFNLCHMSCWLKPQTSHRAGARWRR